MLAISLAGIAAFTITISAISEFAGSSPISLNRKIETCAESVSAEDPAPLEYAVDVYSPPAMDILILPAPQSWKTRKS